MDNIASLEKILKRDRGIVLSGLVGMALLALAGNAFCGRWAIERFARNDPQQLVVDEVLGVFVALAFTGFAPVWVALISGFALFRVFDILKPFPVRQMERLPGWAGIAMDDLAAGVMANLALRAGFFCYNAILAA